MIKITSSTSSECGDLLANITGEVGGGNLLVASCLETCLGIMLAVANEEALHLLAFTDCCDLAREISYLKQNANATIILGNTKPISSIANELQLYFNGKLSTFTTPLFITGSPFRKRVWNALTKIPYGETCSYSDIAMAINQPTACRAVAQANGYNQHAIIIPCHRVINANGELGGYSSGIARKKWLIHHEKSNKVLV